MGVFGVLVHELLITVLEAFCDVSTPPATCVESSALFPGAKWQIHLSREHLHASIKFELLMGRLVGTWYDMVLRYVRSRLLLESMPC